MTRVDPDFWWDNIHSGSEAIESARKYLADSRGVLQEPGLTSFELAMVCSELIFRVTGEKVSPVDGFAWAPCGNRIEGPYFASMDFDAPSQ